MVKAICDFCEKQFDLKGKSYIKKHNFCSKECYFEYKRKKQIYNKDKKERIIYKCKNCNKDVAMLESQSKNKKNIFCSKDCRYEYDRKQYSGSGNPNYKFGNIEIECLNCTNKFTRPSNQKGRAKYCSKKCKDEYWSNVLSKTPENQERLRLHGVKTKMNQKNKFTKPERIMMEYFENNKIDFIPQHPMFDRFVVDFYIPSKNMIIEVLGDYWHGNPLKIKEDKLTDKQIKNKEKDIIKLNYFTSNGFIIHMIWENDIYKNFNDVIKLINLI